jgi:hypothetical protein
LGTEIVRRPEATLSQLRLYRNVDVLTAFEAGMISRGDDEQLAAASASARVLYSFNVPDYCVIHQAWITEGRFHAGIAMARHPPSAKAEQTRGRHLGIETQQQPTSAKVA